jgi:hypothetical protein
MYSDTGVVISFLSNTCIFSAPTKLHRRDPSFRRVVVSLTILGHSNHQRGVGWFQTRRLENNVLIQRRASIIRVLEPVEFVSHTHQNFLFAFIPTAEEAAEACLLVCFCTVLGFDEGYAGAGDHREVW